MLTTPEVAARLGISRRRVGQLIKDGRLRATKHGRDWLVSERAVDAYVPQEPGWKKGRPRRKKEEDGEHRQKE